MSVSSFNKIAALLILILILHTQLTASGKDTTEVRQPYQSDNKNFTSMIVASVGDKKITAEEFLLSYEYGPAFVKREKDSPKRYLDFMIYEKLLALEGYSRGVDKSEELNQILSDIEGDLATEQLYRKIIWDKLKVSKKEINKGVAQSLIALNIKWIFEHSWEEIEDNYKKIKSGISFDSLFNRQFIDSVNYDDRFMETTRFNLEKANPFLARVVDSLKAGEISPPIKTPDGFYIVKLDNIWKKMITTESETNKLKNDVEEVLLKEKADSLSDKYVHNLLINEKPVIIRETFNMLKAYIGNKILSPGQYAQWDLLKNIHPSHPDFNPGNIAPYMSNKLVDLKGGAVTLEDFLRWYKTREPYINLGKKSHQALFASLEQVVWRMVRDRLLTKIAIKKNFNRKNEVLRQTQWWRDKLVYSQMKLDIAGSISLDDIKIKEYYESYKRRYLDEKGSPKSFEQAKSDVRNDLYAYEYTKKVVNKILGLKGRTKIKIYEDVLEKLPVDIKNDPKAIDVYSAKTGGTFMRQAFPVIDYEWQFWN